MLTDASELLVAVTVCFYYYFWCCVALKRTAAPFERAYIIILDTMQSYLTQAQSSSLGMSSIYGTGGVCHSCDCDIGYLLNDGRWWVQLYYLDDCTLWAENQCKNSKYDDNHIFNYNPVPFSKSFVPISYSFNGNLCKNKIYISWCLNKEHIPKPIKFKVCICAKKR